MGTRNLTVVYLDGQYKVAQYGQWDGYPEGQGLTALSFLREKMNVEQFKSALRNSSYISNEEITDLYRKYGASEKDYPNFSRDTGAEILEMIQNHPDGLKLKDDINFVADSLFCEWVWVIDLDVGTFEGYCGFNNTTPLTKDDRFYYFLRNLEENGYFGVRLVAKWSFDALPTDEEFLDTFKYEEE